MVAVLREAVPGVLPQGMTRADARRFFDALEGLEGLSDEARLRLAAAVRREIMPEPLPSDGWSFFMVHGGHMLALLDAIRALPAAKRPQEVRHALDLCLCNLRWDTGEVMLSRDDFAKAMGVHPSKVSHALGVLSDLGVIIRERRPGGGARGLGRVRYIFNPHAAWRGTQEARRVAADQFALPLRVVHDSSGRDPAA